MVSKQTAALKITSDLLWFYRDKNGLSLHQLIRKDNIRITPESGKGSVQVHLLVNKLLLPISLK
jgi:hypothetical protein